MKIPVYLSAIVAIAAPLSAAPKKPAPARSTIAPVGSYATYALSKTSASFELSNPRYVSGEFMAPTLKGRGKGFVTLACGSSQTTLKMPMGWFGHEDGGDSNFFTPDERTRITMGFRDQGAVASPFAHLQQTRLAETRAQMKAMKQKVNVRGFSLPGGSYAVEITNVTTQSGGRNGFLQVFTPNPQKPRYPMSLSLTAPMSVFPKYRGLVGLILRDRKIIWTT